MTTARAFQPTRPTLRTLARPQCCYACGASLSPQLFRGNRQKAFELILANPGINATQLTATIYANDPNGGLADTSSLRSMLKHMKPTLLHNGYVLDWKAGRTGGYTFRTNEKADA
jgi:hypothetical protein